MARTTLLEREVVMTNGPFTNGSFFVPTAGLPEAVAGHPHDSYESEESDESDPHLLEEKEKQGEVESGIQKED